MNCPVIHQIRETNKKKYYQMWCVQLSELICITASGYFLTKCLCMRIAHRFVVVFFLCSRMLEVGLHTCACVYVCALVFVCVCVIVCLREREYPQKKVTAFESCAKHIWTYLVYCNNTNNNNDVVAATATAFPFQLIFAWEPTRSGGIEPFFAHKSKLNDDLYPVTFDDVW